jgi:myo-inositol 2-dehydrogenase/D-chiro-inositol 1-dehydrogenase
MKADIQIGIIGSGRIGQIHARNLCQLIPEARVAAISDPMIDVAQQCAQRYGIERVLAEPGDLLAIPEIDAVVICSPTDTHADLITAAAQAGKHIFCEKPIALDLNTIDAALAAVAQAGVKLQIGFNRRFDPGFAHARAAVAKGQIGTPHLVRITSRDPELPPLAYISASGGLFLDMTIHDFDMSRFILGEEITEVFAVGGALVDPAVAEAGDIDTAVITLNYESGAFAVIDNSRQAVYGYDQRLEVFGSEGCIVVGNRTPHEGTLYTRQTVQDAKPLYFFLERYQESFLEELRQFVRALVDDTPPAVSGFDGRVPVTLALAAQESLRQRRSIPLDVRPQEK